MQNKKYTSFLVISIVTIGFLIAAPAFAQGGKGLGIGKMGRGGQRSGVFGTVSAISGNTITVTSKAGQNGGTATTYAVDATNAKITKNNATGTVSSIAVGDTIVVQGTISGTNVAATNIRDGAIGKLGGDKGGMGVGGTVASINGTTLTVTGRAMPNGGTAPTYTVDASGATVTKNGATSSVSSIAVGDTVRIQGTVNGTSVTAKNIIDGVEQPVIQGNGQPIVAGKITAISGNTITITNNSNVTYTIDATNAKVSLGNQLSSISNLANGDNVVVQGTVNGTSVVASSIVDQKPKTDNNSDNNEKSRGFMGSMMDGVGSFFKHLFGF